MGKSGSGKTSMRSIIFSNHAASGTARFGATIDVEMNHVRFLGSVILNLWDCGGQEAFMDQYLTRQRSTIFSDVGVLIYVFDVESRDTERDLGYYIDCLDACRKNSPDAEIFVLLHKMDLCEHRRDPVVVFNTKRQELLKYSNGAIIKMFPTSIYDESLYRAWSRIVHSLIPNAPLLSQHLTTFADICNAVEVVLFERTTFLIIARSGTLTGDLDEVIPPELADTVQARLNPERFEKLSELIRAFRTTCSKLQERFHSLEIRFHNYSAVLELMTQNTYVMAIIADPDVQNQTIRMNIKLARDKFEELASAG